MGQEFGVSSHPGGLIKLMFFQGVLYVFLAVDGGLFVYEDEGRDFNN